MRWNLRRARQANVTVILTDDKRTQMCSVDYVEDLCHRIQDPAIATLYGDFGDGWALEIQPDLILEGPGLAFGILIVEVKGWTIARMSRRIAEVFNRQWDKEIDRFPPR